MFKSSWKVHKAKRAYVKAKRAAIKAYEELEAYAKAHTDTPNDFESTEFDQLVKAREVTNEQALWAELEHLSFRASRMDVYFPQYPRLDKSIELPHLKKQVLKPKEVYAIQREIRGRKLERFGMFFGACSLIQAVFAVVSYFWPRH